MEALFANPTKYKKAKPLVERYGEPIRYVSNKVGCLIFDPDDFKSNSKGYLRESKVQLDPDTPQPWVDELYDAPIGSILCLPQNIDTDASKNFYGKKHFVKTTHFAEMLQELKESETSGGRTYSSMHGNSGVGKTHALDLLCEVAKAKKYFVIHYSRSVYEKMWEFDDVTPGSYRRRLLKELVDQNPPGIWEKYLGFKVGRKATTKEEKKKADIYARAKKIVDLGEIMTTKSSELALAERTLGDIYEELAKSEHRVVVVLDDINTLTKGSVRTAHRFTPEQVRRHQTTGTAILNLVRNDSTSSFQHAQNFTIFAAASQHFRDLERMGHAVKPKRIRPNSSIWDMMGLQLFAYRFTRRIGNLENADDGLCARLARVCMVESGLLLRLLVVGLNDGAQECCNTDSYEKKEEQEDLVDKFVKALKDRVTRNVEQRYLEVFKSFFLRYDIEVSIESLLMEATPEQKALNFKFIENTMNIFRKPIFDLSEERKNPYFDTGLITESMRRPSKGFGFVSNLARTVYGEQLARHSFMKSNPLVVTDSDWENFQERVEGAFKFRGFVPNHFIREYSGKRAAKITKVPAAFMTIKLKFQYNRGQKRAADGEAKASLKSVDFVHGDEMIEFQDWMDGCNDVSQSVMFVGEGKGARDMPAFDQVLVSKTVEQSQRDTHFYAFQCSMEEMKNGVMKSTRFDKMKENGKALLTNIVRIAYQNEDYSVNVKRDKTLGIVRGKKRKIAIPNTDVACFYINPRELASKTKGSVDPGFILNVLGPEAVCDCFQIQYK